MYEWTKIQFEIDERVRLVDRSEDPILDGLYGKVSGYGTTGIPILYTIILDYPLSHPNFREWTAVTVPGLMVERI